MYVVAAVLGWFFTANLLLMGLYFPGVLAATIGALLTAAVIWED